MPDIDNTMGKVRRMVLEKAGATGVREVGIRLRNMDSVGSGYLSQGKFLAGLNYCGVNLSSEEVDVILSTFAVPTGQVEVDAFMERLCGPWNPPRRALLDRIFSNLDEATSGYTDLTTLRNSYMAAHHPHVLQGKRKELEVSAEFESVFDTHTNPTGKVSLMEFYEFYAGISVAIDDDAYFEALVKDVWHPDSRQTSATTQHHVTSRQTPKRTDGGHLATTDTGKLYVRQYAEVTLPKVFMDISIANSQSVRVVIELFKDVAPKTCENFRALCTGERGIGLQGKPLRYRGLKFHRIVPGLCIQGGDVIFNNGKGGESIYGRYFSDETFEIPFTEPGLVAMANNGPNTNNSQFFFAMKEARYLDDRHTVFGRVVQNLDFLKRVEKWGTDGGIPLKDVEIVDCGQLSS